MHTSRLSRSVSLLAGALLAACASSPQPAPQSPTRVTRTYIEAPEPDLDGELADLVMRLYSGQLAVREAAARELAAIGAAAVPALSELIACAGTEPFEGGSREDGDLDPGYLAETEPVGACAEAIVAVSADDPTALVRAMTVPLDTKRSALAALGAVGPEAVPAVAAVYTDACERSAIAATDGAVMHLRATADAALAALAAHPDAAADALGDDTDCARAGAERVRQIAGGVEM